MPTFLICKGGDAVIKQIYKKKLFFFYYNNFRYCAYMQRQRIKFARKNKFKKNSNMKKSNNPHPLNQVQNVKIIN